MQQIMIPSEVYMLSYSSSYSSCSSSSSTSYISSPRASPGRLPLPQSPGGCRSVMVLIVDQTEADQKQVDQMIDGQGVNQMVKDSSDQEKEQPQEMSDDGQLDKKEVMMVEKQKPNEDEGKSCEAVAMEEVEDDAIATPVVTIPSKSRSLRTTSVRKRLEIEVKMKQPKTKGRMSKKARLSKYRRKSANAKERERMKKQNDVFEVISSLFDQLNIISKRHTFV